jgi:GMP synthase-like glutamine amidotransferase
VPTDASGIVHDRSRGAVLVTTDLPTIGILVCDHVMPELQDASTGEDYGEMYTRFLRSAEPDLEVRVYDVIGGGLPDDPAECDGWIITGARYDANSDEPWVAALRDLIAGIDAAQVHAAGICFGHQVLAEALGGRTGRAGVWKAGPQRLVLDDTPWFEGGELDLHAMHQDVVLEAPPGATVIGRGTTADVPAFVLGEHVLGIQDHPEFSDRYIRGLIEVRRPRMGDEVTDQALAEVDTRGSQGPDMARRIVDFLLDRRRT